MSPPQIELVPVPVDVLRLLADWDLVAASRAMGLPIPPDALDQQWVWNAFHIRSIAAPEHAFWFTRYLVVEENRVVGHVGMHAPPDDGVVTIGYRTESTQRRRGVAVAATGQLLDVAASRPDVRLVKALVSPSNHASLAVCDRLGFTDAGEERHAITGQMMRRLELPMRRPGYS